MESDKQLQLTHTSKPWKWTGTKGRPESRAYLYGSSGLVFADVNGVAISDSDANLIMSAPDLLEAAIEIREAILDGGLDATKGPKLKRLLKAAKELDNAISKAINKDVTSLATILMSK